MVKEENLKKKLSDLRAAIKANSKDDKLATKLIADLLNVKGVLSKNPLPIGELGKELGSFKGGTFAITKFEHGVVYHIYNSIDLVVRPNITSLYYTLVDYVDNKELYEKLEGEEREKFELELSAVSYILSMPLYVFTDATFCFEMASHVVKFLQGKLTEVDNQELQKENVALDEEFKESSLASDMLSE